MRFAKLAGFAAVAILSAAFVVYRSSGPEAPQKSPATKSENEPVKTVRLVRALTEKLPRTVRASGTLTADEEVTASFKVAGRIREALPDLGDSVAKGQMLASLDTADFRLKVEQARASVNQLRVQLGLSPDGEDDRTDPESTPLVREARAVLENARQNRERLSRLVEKGLEPRSSLDDSDSELLVAESRYQSALQEIRNRQALLVERRLNLAIANQQLAEASLASPIDGSVLEKNAGAGEYVSAGDPVYRLVRVNPLRLRLSVNEREAASLKAGQKVSIVAEGAAAPRQGVLTRLSPAISEKNRTLTVEALVENADKALRPGSFARAEISLAGREDSLTVPSSSVVSFAGLEKVLTVKDGKVSEIRVRTGEQLPNRIEIVEGLAPGTEIIAEPGNLADGQAVSVER
jgi:RND family efflux transporter MFP subunit